MLREAKVRRGERKELEASCQTPGPVRPVIVLSFCVDGIRSSGVQSNDARLNGMWPGDCE